MAGSLRPFLQQICKLFYQAALQIFLHELQVDHIPEGFDVLGARIAIINVVRMLPNIAGQDGRLAYSESYLRFTFRGSGAPWWRAALTPRNSSITLSPYVALATRTG